MRAEIVNKLLSGRYYLTIVGGIVFTYSVYAKILTPEAIASIVTMIFVSYFQKQERDHQTKSQ